MATLKMFRLEYFEDDKGNETMALISDNRFEIMSLVGDKEPELFALTLTDEMIDAINRGAPP